MRVAAVYVFTRGGLTGAQLIMTMLACASGRGAVFGEQRYVSQ
jgi:hypothetical protein